MEKPTISKVVQFGKAVMMALANTLKTFMQSVSSSSKLDRNVVSTCPDASPLNKQQNAIELEVKKPTITIKPYTHSGEYLKPQRAIGVVKSLLIELAPDYYPDHNAFVVIIKVENVDDFNEQVQAVAGWCMRELEFAVPGGYREERLKNVLKKCIDILSKQQISGM